MTSQTRVKGDMATPPRAPWYIQGSQEGAAPGDGEEDCPQESRIHLLEMRASGSLTMWGGFWENPLR